MDVSRRKGLKRKLEQDFQEERQNCKLALIDPQPEHDRQGLLLEIRSQVEILDYTFSSDQDDRADAKRAAHALSELAKNGTPLLLYADQGCNTCAYYVHKLNNFYLRVYTYACLAILFPGVIKMIVFGRVGFTASG